MEHPLTVTRARRIRCRFKVDSWQNGINRNVESRTVRRVLGYNGNGAHFRRTTDEVAKGGYQEFAFRWPVQGRAPVFLHARTAG